MLCRRKARSQVPAVTAAILGASGELPHLFKRSGRQLELLQELRVSLAEIAHRPLVPDQPRHIREHDREAQKVVHAARLQALRFIAGSLNSLEPGFLPRGFDEYAW